MLVVDLEQLVDLLEGHLRLRDRQEVFDLHQQVVDVAGATLLVVRRQVDLTRNRLALREQLGAYAM